MIDARRIPPAVERFRQTSAVLGILGRVRAGGRAESVDWRRLLASLFGVAATPGPDRPQAVEDVLRRAFAGLGVQLSPLEAHTLTTLVLRLLDEGNSR